MGRHKLAQRTPARERYLRSYYKHREEKLPKMRESSRRWYWTEHEKKLERRREQWAQRTQRAKELFGKKCVICGEEFPDKTIFTHIHEIYGNHHKYWDFEKHPENYVLLCAGHHRGVHFCMEYLGMSWEEIKQRLVKKIDKD